MKSVEDSTAFALADDAEQQAFRKHNASVVQELQELLEDNPAKNMESYISHLQENYPKRRKRVGERARRIAALTDDAGEAMQTIVVTGFRSISQIQDGTEVVLPLSGNLSRLLCYDEVKDLETNRTKYPSRFLSPKQTAQLNKLIHQGEIIHSLGGLSVLDIGHDIVVKIGHALDIGYLSDLATIQQSVPDIPIPETYAVLRDSNNKVHIFMSKAEGQSLDRLWPKLSIEQNKSVQSQLAHFFHLLRSISPPLEPDELHTPWGGGQPRRCKDVRRIEKVAENPIYTEEQFNLFLLESYDRARPRSDSRLRILKSFLRNDHKVVMTHADLHPRNICAELLSQSSEGNSGMEMDKESCIKVTGILDWETCGWYPEYWEYVKALNTIDPGDGLDDWWEYLPTESIGTWPYEYAIDLLLEKR
ncbi:hypothetical protein H072_8489 [Dactylellina haptotyla CBS 200.50]|uniref:Uncharacterized protein n=1 Tax=Dactylellina haptotyla (strain CBS 200.50) TaxID=1284197 RepID=S8A4H5_DACHA|nr:hypothetical protein H072_8489 [Dactylellina haptotyla CBS 200.50]